MPILEVFDRPLCCATGVCGVDVDQAPVTFAAERLLQLVQPAAAEVR